MTEFRGIYDPPRSWCEFDPYQQTVQLSESQGNLDMLVHSILIVDDDVPFGRLVKRVISRMGHNVDQISKPREILEFYDNFAPDIIFLDILMPDFDGIEVARWLLKKRFTGKLVFMTGGNPKYLTTARDLVEGYGEISVATLEKPFRVNEVRELVNA